MAGLPDVEAVPVVQAYEVFEPSANLSQLGRMEDKQAAKLIAGAAGIDETVVWVICEGGSAWFDKSDERRLMAYAWENVIEKENQVMDQMVDSLSVNSAMPRPKNQRTRLNVITETLKEFRQTQLSMRVESFAPAAEECMVGLVMGLCDEHDLFDNLPETTRDDESANDKNPIVHHDDKIRRLSRMLRRLPVTRNQFCRTTGCVLRYSLCLQEGSAVTTRRLNQIQSDMIRSKGALLRYVYTHYEEIIQTVNRFYHDDKNMYVFDWASHEMQKIDSEQFVPNPEKTQRPSAGLTKEGQGAYYTMGE